MQALRQILQEDLTVVAGVSSLGERKAQGWNEIDSSFFDFCILPKTGWWKFATNLIKETSEGVHLFGGIFADKRFFLLMLYCKIKGIKFALMSEPYAETAVGYFRDHSPFFPKIKLYLRPLIYRLAGFFLGRELFAFFPISEMASTQFRRNGFRSAAIYPFGYFVPKSSSLPSTSLVAASLSVTRIIFVGNLIRRKGIHILLDAWRECQHHINNPKVQMMLDIYGTGEIDERDLPLNAYVRGPIPFGHAQSVMAQYDALILPSLHDGWGVVVNEALLQGVPALVSDRVGAQALVKAANAGAVFKADSVTALVELFVRIADDPLQLKDWANGARKLADSLEPSAGADYLLACLEHADRGVGPAPTPPWTGV